MLAGNLVRNRISSLDLVFDILQVAQLIGEMTSGLTKVQAVQFDDKDVVVERLCAYARSVAHFPTAVKEFEWRNGFFYTISQGELAAGKADPFPTHTAWLKEVGAI